MQTIQQPNNSKILTPRSNWRPVAMREAMRFNRSARGQRLRSRVEFAEQEIVLPEGPNAGEHWRPHFQPYAYLALKLMDTLGFRKIRGVGCVQSGKTFNFDIVPLAFHIKERKEHVIFGVPEMELAEMVWVNKIRPVFEASPGLRSLLPRKGGGSRDGFAELIRFRNGATLKFMGGTGKDSRRSSATAQVIIKTEVDRYDTAAASSRETSPVEQMEARGESFDDQVFSYEECTVTDEDGRIWTEFNEGTGTELFTQCVGCRQPVLPGREHLTAIDDAADVIAAAELGRFFCPHCGLLWDEADRRRMVTIENLIPVHMGDHREGQTGLGQTIRLGDDGRCVVEGPMPRTEKLSIRWNAFTNLFWKTSSIAKAEWRALYSKKPEEMDTKREQFAWTKPRKPRETVLVALTVADIYKRMGETHSAMGVVPPYTRWLTRGVDLRGTQLHYVVRAWCSQDAEFDSARNAWTGGTWWSKAIDMSTFDVPRDELGQRAALVDALTHLRTEKPSYYDARGNEHVVNLSIVDGSWMEEVVFGFMLDLKAREIPGWLVVMGRGQSEPPGRGSYVEPRNVDPAKGPILWNGEQIHIRLSNKHGIPFAMINSDHWKSFLRDGYKTPDGQNGSLTHFDPSTAEQKAIIRRYCKEVAAEKRIRRKVPGRGVVDVFINESDAPNHYGDCDYYSCGAANILGVRIVTRERPSVPQPTNQTTTNSIKMPDGRPYMGDQSR